MRCEVRSKHSYPVTRNSGDSQINQQISVESRISIKHTLLVFNEKALDGIRSCLRSPMLPDRRYDG